MTVESTLSLRINGEHRRVPEGTTLAELINSIGQDPGRVAVERNTAIVPRSTFGTLLVEDGDDYEIVHFVGGG